MSHGVSAESHVVFAHLSDFIPVQHNVVQIQIRGDSKRPKQLARAANALRFGQFPKPLKRVTKRLKPRGLTLERAAGRVRQIQSEASLRCELEREAYLVVPRQFLLLDAASG